MALALGITSASLGNFMELTELSQYIIQILRRNPNLQLVKNLKIDGIIRFLVGEKLVGVRINYTYGVFNENFRTEDFPVLPPEWDLHEERICFVNGHIGTASFFPPSENRRDELSRQAILG